MDRRLSIGIRAAWHALLIAVGLCVLTWAANEDLSPPPGAQPTPTFGQFLVAGLFVWAVAFILIAGARLLLGAGRKVSGSVDTRFNTCPSCGYTVFNFSGDCPSCGQHEFNLAPMAGSARPVRPLREHVPQHIKDQVWRRDQGRCVWCQSDYRLEFDHIQPVVAGGRSNYRNVRLLCERCNQEKGARW